MDRKEIIKKLKELKSAVITSQQLKELFPIDFEYGKKTLNGIEVEAEHLTRAKNCLQDYENGKWVVKITFKKVVGFALAETIEVFTLYPKEGSWFDDIWEAFTDKELQDFADFLEKR